MKLSFLVLPLALAACEPAPRAPQPDASGAAPPAVETLAEPDHRIASSAQLAGEYRVAGVGNQAVDLPYAITASIGDARIRVVADCVNLAWDYRLENGKLTTERVPVESCARGLVPIEAALAAALDGADKVVRTPANGYQLTGRGPSATLFSQ